MGVMWVSVMAVVQLHFAVGAGYLGMQNKQNQSKEKDQNKKMEKALETMDESRSLASTSELQDEPTRYIHEHEWRYNLVLLDNDVSVLVLDRAARFAARL